MCPKDVDKIANSVDPDQTRSSLIWVFTVCPDLSVWKLRNNTVIRNLRLPTDSLKHLVYLFAQSMWTPSLSIVSSLWQELYFSIWSDNREFIILDCEIVKGNEWHIFYLEWFDKKKIANSNMMSTFPNWTYRKCDSLWQFVIKHVIPTRGIVANCRSKTNTSECVV